MRWVAEKLRKGETVSFRPKGNSMQPLVFSGDEVTVVPLGHNYSPGVGDIVLVSVGGAIYLHLVKAIDGQGRFQIASNRGRVNGWVGRHSIHGVCTSVRGQLRRRHGSGWLRRDPRDTRTAKVKSQDGRFKGVARER